jgi:hypothetical protein
LLQALPIAVLNVFKVLESELGNLQTPKKETSVMAGLVLACPGHLRRSARRTLARLSAHSLKLLSLQALASIDANSAPLIAA